MLCQKWDLAIADGITNEKKALEALRAMMPFLNFAPVVFCSNKSGYNVRKTVEAIDRAAASASERLPTGMLNRVLTTATKKTLAPMEGQAAQGLLWAAGLDEPADDPSLRERSKAGDARLSCLSGEEHPRPVRARRGSSANVPEGPHAERPCLNLIFRI